MMPASAWPPGLPDEAEVKILTAASRGNATAVEPRRARGVFEAIDTCIVWLTCDVRVLVDFR